MRHSSHDPSKRALARSVVSMVFSFFLSLALVLEALMLVVHFGLFTKSGLIGVLDDAYYQYVLNYIEDKAYHYSIPTSIDPEPVKDLFSSEDVRYDVNQFISAALDGEEYTPDTTKAEEELTTRVNNVFTSGGVKQSAKTDEIASAYVSDIMNIYKNDVKMPGIGTLGSIRRSYDNYLVFMCFVTLLFMAVLVVALRRLYRYAHRALHHVGYALGGAALMCFVAPFAFYRSGYYLGLNLTPQYFYHFGTSLIERLLFMCFFAAGIYFALMCIVAARATVLRRRAHHPDTFFV